MDAPLLNIGGMNDNSTAVSVASVIALLEAGHTFHTSETVMLASLKVIQTAGSVEGMTISSCNFVGEKTVNQNADAD